jgi:hypothetical protein
MMEFLERVLWIIWIGMLSGFIFLFITFLGECLGPCPYPYDDEIHQPIGEPTEQVGLTYNSQVCDASQGKFVSCQRQSVFDSWAAYVELDEE